MFQKKFFSSKKVSKGFTLVEIIVVLVILAILAAAIIPSMLGFVNDAKKKSHISEVKAVYTAAQAYATEHFAKGDLDASKLNGDLNSNHVLHNLLQNDATGRIFGAKVENGKVKSFTYVKSDIRYDYTVGSGVKSSEYVSSATFDTGKNANIKMKNLAGNASAAYDTEDNSIQGFVKESTLLTGLNTGDSANIISANDSEYPIFAWYANDKIHYYTEADNVSLNASSNHLFYKCKALTDISGLQGLNTSAVTTLVSVFNSCSSLSDISALSSWDTSSVTGMYHMFSGCSGLTSLSALSSWDTSSVTNMYNMFNECSGLISLDGISSWNISSLTSMEAMFMGCSGLTSLSALTSWNTSSVTNLRRTFCNCTGLTSLDGISGWNVSSVNTVHRMFESCNNLTSAKVLDSWSTYLTGRDVSKSYMFSGSGVTSGNYPSWYSGE